jgi:hypothetical protein
MVGKWCRRDGLSTSLRHEMQKLCCALSVGIVDVRIDDWTLKIRIGEERRAQIFVDLESWVDVDRTNDNDYPWIFLDDMDRSNHSAESEILLSINQLASKYGNSAPLCKIIHKIIAVCSRILFFQDDQNVLSALTLLKDEIVSVQRKQIDGALSNGVDKKTSKHNHDIFAGFMRESIQELKSVYPNVDTHVSTRMPSQSNFLH